MYRLRDMLSAAVRSWVTEEEEGVWVTEVTEVVTEVVVEEVEEVWATIEEGMDTPLVSVVVMMDQDQQQADKATVLAMARRRGRERADTTRRCHPRHPIITTPIIWAVGVEVTIPTRRAAGQG